MSNRVKAVDPGSPAERAGIRPGDALLSLNGNQILDVLDYKYFGYEARLAAQLRRPDGSIHTVRIKKREGEDLGLDFDTYLMDRARSCANRCIFCFIDQLPAGMRPTLYFKDDDARLSFLLGNYITMTNLSPREVQRMIDLRVSPINISVHTTEPELRAKMLGNPRGASSLDYLHRFCQAGLTMNCQIVLCPEVNDGAHLDKTLQDLTAMYPAVNSVSVVPVGLTRYRQGLYPLRAMSKEEARQAIGQIDHFGRACLQRHGYRVVYAADELYLKAGLPIPPISYYDDFPQFENGVGMLRQFEDDFEESLPQHGQPDQILPFSIATGVAAAPFLRRMVEKAGETWHNSCAGVYAVENRFFGSEVTVAGLVTGGDLIGQLKGRNLGRRLLLPSIMLRDGDGSVFLDDVSVADVERELGVPVLRCRCSAEELITLVLDGVPKEK